jgi:signal transduction histidine kinase
VQRIVEEHGGTLTAANRPSIGAVMKVSLPCPGARVEPGPHVVPEAMG